MVTDSSVGESAEMESVLDEGRLRRSMQTSPTYPQQIESHPPKSMHGLGTMKI